jgi:hypothetical protein
MHVYNCVCVCTLYIHAFLTRTVPVFMTVYVPVIISLCIHFSARVGACVHVFVRACAPDHLCAPPHGRYTLFVLKAALPIHSCLKKMIKHKSTYV